LQALFGLLRLGTLIKFAPQPVMAGFQNMAAVLLFLVQLGNVLGFDHNVGFTRVFGEGIGRPDTFFFSPASFLPGFASAFPVTNPRLISELPAQVERLALPVLDLARDLRGLDVVMNDPSRFPLAHPPSALSPQNLADEFVSFGRKSCLKTLIVSWLARSPNFENRVAALRAFVRTRVDVSEADLDRLVACLRQAA